MMKVSDLMTRAVCSCRAGMTLNEAARIMWEYDCGAVPIVDADDSSHVIGIVTDRDIAMAAYIRGQALGSIPVESVMARNLVTCVPDDSVEAAERAMADAHVRRLPVLDEDGRLIGLFSLAQLARAVSREDERRGDERSTDDGESFERGERELPLATQLGDTLSRICISRRASLDTF